MGFLDNSEEKKEKSILTAKDMAKKYSVILTVLNNEEIRADFVSNEKAGGRFFIRDDLNFFSREQKMVLRDVKELSAWDEKIDLDFFFENLKKSGFSIYLKKEDKIKKVFFSEKEDLNLPAEFFIAKDDHFHPIKKDDFVLRIIKEDDFFNHGRDILLGEKKVYFFKNNTIYQKVLGNNLRPVFVRLLKKEYDRSSNFFSEKFETKLSEEEILKVNEILKEAEEFFQLKNISQKEFLVEEVGEADFYLEINFDSQNKKLEIRPVADYHFKKIDISESVYHAQSKGQSFFVRKSHYPWGEKYLYKAEKNKIYFSRVRAEEEIEFFKTLFAFRGELGFSKKLKLKKEGAKQIKNFLEKNWNNYRKIEYKKIFLKDKLDRKVLDFYADLSVDYGGPGSRENFLSFEADLYLGKDRVKLEDLQNYVRGKSEYIYNEKGESIEVKNKKELERFLEILENFQQQEDGNKFQGKLHNAFELENFFTSSEHYNAKFNQGFKNFISEAREGKIIQKEDIEKKYLNFLRDYQIDGLN